MSTIKAKYVSAPVNGATVEPLVLQTNNLDRMSVDSSGGIDFGNSFVKTSSGNVGINTSSPAYRLDVSGAVRGRGDFYFGWVNGSQAGVWWAQSNYAVPAFQGLTSAGNVGNIVMQPGGGDLLVGQTSVTGGVSPTSAVDVVAGGLLINATRRTTGAAGNTLWDSAGVFYRQTSSLKYKRDVEDISYGLTQVMALRPVTFASKSEVDKDTRFGGLIAEEVHDLGLTEFVAYDSDGTPDGLHYGNMVALAFKAIQEQQQMIETLQAKIAALEAQ